MRAWLTTEGGHLVVATDFMLGGGLVNMAESLCEAVAQEFGDPVTVVRHFPARTMLAHGRDRFDLLVLNTEGIAETHTCTEEILGLLGPSVLGFPGDTRPGRGRGRTGAVPERAHGASTGRDAAAQAERHWDDRGQGPGLGQPLGLGASTLERLADFLANALVDDEATGPGDKREQKLEEIVAALKDQAWELMAFSDPLESEARARG
nr:hypothetical protein OG409_37760 [Streptomyces sp. NBC_00974]